MIDERRFRGEDPRWGGIPPAYSYVAIADGTKRKNFARIYAGWYTIDAPRSSRTLHSTTSLGSDLAADQTGTQYTINQRKKGRVPILLIVKVGNEEERITSHPKPGNRGKRDSQVLLLSFLTKLLFDDRMTELEFDLFFKLYTLTGVHPSLYETVLFVDADTMVYPDSIRHMVTAFVKDASVIGICGETRVGNPWGSWVTMIHVGFLLDLLGC
jgi:chitin synthase